ncbi:ABC1-domain-containing protein [Auriscalpium vulgare]|uniref:ABC1-domain-containing protein n=1 Tax=Auriscalpium vulgare TaxID=40419 RepID=A0ACB8S8T1_9AGAM|nr:ABC1-domain-containing protein [Auriscalpium vulgare]
MALRLSVLPPSLRLALLPPPPLRIRHASRWARDPVFSSFFTRAPAALPRMSIRRIPLWVLPLAGGLTLYFLPPSRSLLPQVFASPALIPCSPSPPAAEPFVSSPSEHEQTISARIKLLLRDFIWEPLLTARRFIHLFALFIPLLLSSPMLLVGTPDARLQGEKWGAVWWYDFLVAQMERAGPTFIKLAQWAASRADLFPVLLCERMGKMHSRGKPHALSHTKAVIERVFRRPFHEVFEEFDEEPIGTGAIAQVYRATLKPNLLPPSYFDPKRAPKHGPKAIAPAILPESSPSVPTAAVAIKVLHPRVSSLIARDLSIMSIFAHIITLFPGMQWVSLPEEVEVFGRMMYEQVDLRKEADNLVTFEEHFMTRSAPITFPRPLTVWSTNDLLVEEYQKALPLEAFLKNGGGPFDDELAELGLDAFLNMLLLDNFVHSDLHPGNIMVKFTRSSTSIVLKNLWSSFFSGTENADPTSPDSDAIVAKLGALSHSPTAWSAELNKLSKEGYLPELVFIDAGLVTTLNEENRRNFLDLFRAVAEFDGYRTGKLMVERCRTPELVIDSETFALKMQHIVLGVKRKTFSLGQIKISDILTDVLRAVRQHHVKMEGDFINTVISILLLEGIGRQLDPSLDLFKSALPILRQLGRQMTAEESMMRMPSGNLTSLLKVWVLLEARDLATAAFVNADDMIRYDWLTPSI